MVIGVVGRLMEWQQFISYFKAVNLDLFSRNVILSIVWASMDNE